MVADTTRRTPMRRAVTDADKGARRAELLDAARAVFAERGYHGTTMADVARTAGLSYGVAYWYFDSKEDLFKATISAEAERLRSAIADALAGTDRSRRDGLRAALEDAVAATFAHFDADPTASALLFREPFSSGADVERHLLGIFSGFIEELSTAVHSGQRRGAVRDAPPELVGFVLAALISAMAMRRLRTDDGLTARAAARFVVTLAFEGVAPR